MFKQPAWLAALCVLLSGAAAVAGPQTNVDECAFIRDGLARLPAAGGEFVVPAGHYTCAFPIVLDRDHLRLRGSGEVTLKLADNANAPLVIMGEATTPPTPVFGVEVADIKLDGNRAHQQMECWSGPCDSGGRSFVRNNGITVRAVINGRIHNVFITGPRSGGVVTEKGCWNLKIDGLTVTNSYFDGFAGYETEGSDLSNMHFFGNLAAGISLDIRFNANTIRHTRIEDNGDVGIFMRDSNDNIFDDVKISGSGSHGIFLSYVDDIYTCPTNNEFRDLSAQGSNGAGFRLNSACEKNRLTGEARFRGNRFGCISEATWMKLGIEGRLICEK